MDVADWNLSVGKKQISREPRKPEASISTQRDQQSRWTNEGIWGIGGAPLIRMGVAKGGASLGKRAGSPTTTPRASRRSTVNFVNSRTEEIGKRLGKVVGTKGETES